MPQVTSTYGVSAPHGKKYSFVDASWEIVGQAPSGNEFNPQSFESVPVSTAKVNPLFADFGGTPKLSSKRYHLPPNLAVDGRRAPEKEEEEARREAQHAEELEAIRVASYKQGRLEASKEAEAEAQQKLHLLEQSFTNVLKDLNGQLQNELQQIEKKAVQLAIDIARKIIDGAVEINPEYIMRVVREALNLAGGAVVRKVRVSPQDMEFIEVVGVAKQLKEYDGTWKFEADSSVRSGCIVETSAGEIDYQLDSAWERVRDNIIKVAK